MNFLADESCSGPVVRALREAGHDVIAYAQAASQLGMHGIVFQSPEQLQSALRKLGIAF